MDFHDEQEAEEYIMDNSHIELVLAAKEKLKSKRQQYQDAGDQYIAQRRACVLMINDLLSTGYTKPLSVRTQVETELPNTMYNIFDFANAVFRILRDNQEPTSA